MRVAALFAAAPAGAGLGGAARTGLVSTLALPPLSDGRGAWLELVKSGELITNGAASLWRGRRRAGAGDRDRRRARHPHGVVEAGQRAAQPAGGDVLPDAEVGADPGDGAVARLRQRLEDPADLPRLHAAGHASAPSTARARASRCWSGRRAAWGRAGCACCGTWWCRARCPSCSTASAPRSRSSFILLVSSELIVARAGLGYLIGFLGADGTYDAMFAVVLTVAFLGFAADRVYLLLMHRVLRWQTRRETAGGPLAELARAPARTAASRVSPRSAGRCARRVLHRRAGGRLGSCSRARGAVTPFMLPPLSRRAGADLERPRRRRPARSTPA